MSRASFDLLERKFSGIPEVRVIYDSDGSALLDGEYQFDLILLISVITTSQTTSLLYQPCVTKRFGREVSS